jgi:hypothetical protein
MYDQAFWIAEFFIPMVEFTAKLLCKFLEMTSVMADAEMTPEMIQNGKAFKSYNLYHYCRILNEQHTMTSTALEGTLSANLRNVELPTPVHTRPL